MSFCGYIESYNPATIMRFLHHEDRVRELTYEDVFLVPQFSDVSSRMDVDLRPVDGTGMTIPVVVANMNAVAGRRMAETITRRGGLVVLPQDMAMDQIERTVRYVKSRNHVLETPVVLDENETIQKALNLLHKRAHGAVVVVDSQQRPVGMFAEKDARDRDRWAALSDVMTRNVVTMTDQADSKVLYDVIRDRRIPVLPVINHSGSLKGVVTEKGLVRSSIYTPAVNRRNELLTAVAVGINARIEEQLTQLKEIGVDIFVLDTAHGAQSKMFSAVERARSFLGDEAIIVAGNIVDEEATRRCVAAGASIVKVGVGPGAMCTTRMMTGVGRPQFSAVAACATVAREMGAHVWADGGVRHPRDVVMAVAAGASAAMFGSWWAGTHESAADMQRDMDGRLFKDNFGMASARAVNDRVRQDDAFKQARKQFFEEGISHSRMYLKEGEESAEDILDKITAGLRSACTYNGAKDLAAFYERAVVGVQTPAGYKEGRPLDMRW